MPRLSQAGRGAAGTKFENVTKHALEAGGYFVVRSARSGGCADLVALKVNALHAKVIPCRALLVQCKRNGDIRLAEWNDLIAMATFTGAQALIAEAGDTVAEVRFWRITGFRKPRMRDTPREPWKV